MTKPKSSWKYFYEVTILNQFQCLLEVMNTAASDIEIKYKDSLEKSFNKWEGHNYFDKDTNMHAGALVGIGTALIIGTDDLIKKIKSYNNGKLKLKLNDSKNNRSPWESAIIAAGNYVRHGDEWHKRYLDFLTKNTVPAIFPEEKLQLINRFLDELTKSGNSRIVENLQALQHYGINLDGFLFGSNSWILAILIKLNNSTFSIDQMRIFLESHHEQIDDQE